MVEFINKNIILKNIIASAFLALMALGANYLLDWVIANHIILQDTKIFLDLFYYWPLIAVWVMLSLILFYIYKATSSSVTHFKEWLTYELRYINKKKGSKFKLGKHKVAIVLFAVTAYYALLLTLMIFVVSPFANWVGAEYVLVNSTEWWSFVINLLPAYVVWFVTIFVFEVGLDFFKAEEKEAMLEAEHKAI